MTMCATSLIGMSGEQEWDLEYLQGLEDGIILVRERVLRGAPDPSIVREQLALLEEQVQRRKAVVIELALERD